MESRRGLLLQGDGQLQGMAASHDPAASHRLIFYHRVENWDYFFTIGCHLINPLSHQTPNRVCPQCGVFTLRIHELKQSSTAQRSS